MEKYPLADPSFFRFPELTSGTVQGILIILVVMIATVVLTILVQRWIYRVSARRRYRDLVGRIAGNNHLTRELQELLTRLGAIAGVRNAHALVRDPGPMNRQWPGWPPRLPARSLTGWRNCGAYFIST